MHSTRSLNPRYGYVKTGTGKGLFVDPLQNSSVPTPPVANDPGSDDGGFFATSYVHHWTGKLMIASDYGYKVWYFRKKKK